MEGAISLILLSVLMFFGSYICGSIPLVVNLSEAKMQIVSIFGAGLLVGTALAVIIPEGVRSLYSVLDDAQHLEKDATGNPTKTFINEDNLHSMIGLTLVFGFLLMLLIDQCSSKFSRGKGANPPYNRLDVEGGGRTAKHDITATLGLVVHAAVDGVALGAAATTTHMDVEMIIFVAIMLHKAPASFALVSFLLHEGLDRYWIRKHLLIFCLSAPVFAIITFFGISQEGKKNLSTMNATGMAMLLSAGTFLYVATVHVLPEITYKAGGSLKPNLLFVLVVGIVLPLTLTLHSH